MLRIFSIGVVGPVNIFVVRVPNWKSAGCGNQDNITAPIVQASLNTQHPSL
jgi:hypothetical protein